MLVEAQSASVIIGLMCSGMPRSSVETASDGKASRFLSLRKDSRFRVARIGRPCVETNACSSAQSTMSSAPNLLLAPKTLQIMPQLRRHGQMVSVEALDLIHRRAGILGQGENVHLALRVDDPHTDGRVA